MRSSIQGSLRSKLSSLEQTWHRTKDFLINSTVVSGSSKQQRFIIFGTNLATLFVYLGLFITYTKQLSFVYVWWPLVEAVRISGVTAARMDKLFPQNNISLNESRSRIIIGYGNIAGIFWSFPFWLIYVAILPTNLNISIAFVACTAFFILVRLMNSFACSFQWLNYILSSEDPESPYRHLTRRASPPKENQDVNLDNGYINNDADCTEDINMVNDINNYDFGYQDELAISNTNNNNNNNSRMFNTYHNEFLNNDTGKNNNQLQQNISVNCTNASNNSSSGSSITDSSQYDISPRTLAAQQQLLTNAADRMLRQKQDEEYERCLAHEVAKCRLKSESTEHSLLKENEEQDDIQNDQNSDNSDIFIEISDEPAKNDTTVVIRYKLPDGQLISRNFDKNSKVEKLYEFLDSHNFKFDGQRIISGRYDLVSNYPRSQYNDMSQILEESTIVSHGSKDDSGAIISRLLYVEFRSETTSIEGTPDPQPNL